MKVRAKELGFFQGRRKPGTVFEFPGEICPKWCEPVDGAPAPVVAPAVDYEAMTRKEIVSALADLGAGFDSTARKDVLLELLKSEHTRRDT